MPPDRPGVVPPMEIPSPRGGVSANAVGLLRTRRSPRRGVRLRERERGRDGRRLRGASPGKARRGCADRGPVGSGRGLERHDRLPPDRRAGMAHTRLLVRGLGAPTNRARVADHPRDPDAVEPRRGGRDRPRRSHRGVVFRVAASRARDAARSRDVDACGRDPRGGRRDPSRERRRGASGPGPNGLRLRTVPRSCRRGRGRRMRGPTERVLRRSARRATGLRLRGAGGGHPLGHERRGGSGTPDAGSSSRPRRDSRSRRVATGHACPLDSTCGSPPSSLHCSIDPHHSIAS